MSHNEHPYRMSRRERHQIGFDHTANKAHGNLISAATVTLTDDYTGAPVPSSILSAVTVIGLKTHVLIGDFSKKGRFKLTFLCTIGPVVFEDKILITVED